ncbi:hypothetical protein AT1219_11220 [Vibrio alginolyticus]
MGRDQKKEFLREMHRISYVINISLVFAWDYQDYIEKTCFSQAKV